MSSIMDHFVESRTHSLCYTMLRCSRETQTDESRSARYRQLRSAALNIPKLSISVEDTGPKGGHLYSVLGQIR